MPRIHVANPPDAADTTSSPTIGTVRPMVNGVPMLARPVPPDYNDWEIPVAKATLDVVSAYRDLQEIDPRALPTNVVDSFRSVCRSVCATVVALDELTEHAWCQEPA
jgi:hypothetical protein